jgi:hypothetical protein
LQHEVIALWAGKVARAQDARRQGDDRAKQLKDSSHRDAYEAEGQKQ